MKLRIGDLVYVDNVGGWKERGLVTALTSRYLAKGCIEILARGKSVRTVLSKDTIVKVVPREELLHWWRLL